MNSTARQRFAQMMQQEQARQAQADMLSQMRGPRPTAPASALTSAPQGQASRMMGAVRMANGGPVGALPTIKELAGLNPPRRDASMNATAPFTQNNPIVPMFNVESPAFGGMQQSTYDWTAPSVQVGQFTQPDRMPPAITPSTSAYRPVDATTLPGGGTNIPNVPVTPNQVLPPMQQPAMQQPAMQPPPVAPAAPAQTAIPNVVTAEDQQQRERDANELARQQAEEDRRRQIGIQAELERQQRLAEQQRQAQIQAEARRLEEEEAQRQTALRAAAQAEQRRQEAAQAQAAQQDERRKRAQEAADAAEKAERARQAEAIKNNRNNAMVNFLTRGIRTKLGGGSGKAIYDPNKMVSVTRLVDGGQGGQYVEKIPQSQYDIEQARAKAYKSAFEE